MEIMTEDNTVQVEETAKVDEPTENIKQLREEFKKLKAENKLFKANAMDSALSSLGLDADKGIGKAVTKLYDGEVTVEAVKEFVAQEFGEVSREVYEKDLPKTYMEVIQLAAVCVAWAEALQRRGVLDET